MATLSTDQKRELAYVLYMQAELTQKEIAEKVKVSENTVSRWVNEGGWKQLKAAHKLTPQNFKKRLYEIVTEIIEGERKPDTNEADALLKYAKAIETLEQKDNAEIYIQVFKSFEAWLNNLDPELTKMLNSYHQDFVQEKINVL